MHRSRALISVFLATLLISSSVAPAFAATRAEMEQHRKAAASARQKAADAQKAASQLQKQVAALDTEIDAIERQSAALEPKISSATERTNRLQGEVAVLSAEAAALSEQIEETQAEYARQSALLQRRVGETYRQGDWFYIDILLGAQDIGDLITRTEFVSRVIEANNDLAAQLESTEETLSRSKVKLDRSLEAVKLKRREAAEVEAALRDMKSERDQQAAVRKSIQTRKSDLVAENKRNAKRLLALAESEEAESQRIANELAAAGQGSGIYGGIMAWPVPSSTRITSRFGWRTHPIFGNRRFHAGIDIGAPYGSAIVSAGPGSVLYVGYRGGYGNTVMIDHGNGVVSLYAHQASGGIKVNTGEQVQRGQRIGTVGSTGNSTGPHLHFEVRVNGVPKNPMGYM